MDLFQKPIPAVVKKLQKRGVHVFQTAIRELVEQETLTQGTVNLVSISAVVPEWRNLPLDKAILLAIKRGAGYVPADIAFRVRCYPQKLLSSNILYFPFRQSGSENENSFYVFALERFSDGTSGIDTMLLWPSFKIGDAKVMLLAPTNTLL